MKKNTPTLGFTMYDVLKFVGEAIKTLFQSNDNRDFKRLKNYLSS